MPTYTPSRKIFRGFLKDCQIDFTHKPTAKVWKDFLVWSQLDNAKHESLVTIFDWVDEYAEFDCAYSDWLAER